MSFDLTNLPISDTFQNILQRTGSDDRLYDLKGREIGDLKISGSLFAQEYVVTSSVTSMSIAFASGSTLFGNTSDDTHQFTGSVFMSGPTEIMGSAVAGEDALSAGNGVFTVKRTADGADNPHVRISTAAYGLFAGHTSFYPNSSHGMVDIANYYASHPNLRLWINPSQTVNPFQIRKPDGSNNSNFSTYDEIFAVDASGSIKAGMLNNNTQHEFSGSINVSGSINLGDEVGFSTNDSEWLLITTGESNRWSVKNTGVIESYAGGYAPQLKWSGGTSTNPVYAFAGDNDTGISSFNPGDRLALIAGGVTGLVVSENNNITSVTASGNISASGKLISDGLKLGDGAGIQGPTTFTIFSDYTNRGRIDLFGGSSENQAQVKLYGGNAGLEVQRNTGIEVTGDITASTNISASGDLIVKQVKIPDTEGNLHTMLKPYDSNETQLETSRITSPNGNISMYLADDLNIANSGFNPTIFGNGNLQLKSVNANYNPSVIIGAEDNETVVRTSGTRMNLKVAKTFSPGSGSNNITINSVKIQDTLQFNGTADYIGVDVDPTYDMTTSNMINSYIGFRAVSGSLVLQDPNTGHITASGNISASGTIIGGGITIDANNSTFKNSTTSTNHTLTIQGGQEADAILKFRADEGDSSVDIATITGKNNTGIEIVTKNNKTEALKIDNSGNLISTSGSLNLIGSGDTGGHITASGDISASGQIITNRIDDGSAQLGIGVDSPGVNLDIKSTTSAANIRVKDSTNKAALFSVTNAGYGIVRGDTGVGLKLDTNGSNTRMTILSDGNIGIGTTSPTRALQVTGDISASGDIIANRYIISSSVTHLTQSFSSGSTLFGDSTDDTHQFTGSLLISGSGKAFKISENGANFFVDPQGENGVVHLGTDTYDALRIKVNNNNAVYITQGAMVQVGSFQASNINTTGNGHITASGNISASKSSTISAGGIISSDTNFQVNGGYKGLKSTGEYLDFQSTRGYRYFKTGGVVIQQLDGTHNTFRIGNVSQNINSTFHGNISASGDMFAHSGSFNYITASGNISSSATSTGSFGHVKVLGSITASNVQVDAGTLFIGGEPFTRENIQTLKQGRSLKPLRVGKARPDFEAEDGRFDGDITASGDILNTRTIQMTNSSSVINTFNTGSHQTCKYVLQVTSGSHIQSSEMLVMQNSSNAFNTEYAQINSGLNLVNFSSKVNTERGTVELIGSSSFISCSVKFVRTLI